MNRLVPFIFLSLVLAGFARAQSLPPVIERYEQLLARSPGKGTAFDKVYQHFFEGEGLEKLSERWKTKAEAAGADAATYWLLLGVLAERQGKAAEAIRLYQKASELRPADARVWMALGEAMIAEGKFPEAIAAFQRALANNPTRDVRPQLYRQLARSQQRMFDTDGAVKTWQQFVVESPDDPFAVEEAADAMVEAERFTEAASLLGKLRDLAGADPFKRVTAIIKLAQLEEKQGRREKARELYESALPLAAEASWIHREVRTRIEEGFRRQDDLPGLASYYQAWLEKRGKDVEAALRLSDALMELNRKKEAVEWLRKATEWAPDRNELLVTLAKRLGEIGEPREAVTILAKLTQGHPEEESYREFLGNAQWQVFEASKDEASKQAAIESWRQLAPAATKDASRVSRVADIFRAKNLTDEALEHDARAASLAPEAPELRQRWAEYLFVLKRDEEAWKVLRELVAGERATPPNFLRLARLQQRHKQPEGALESITKGLAIEPKNFELLMLQWRLFADQQKWEPAAALFDRLLAAAPGEYSIEQVEDGQIQALRALSRLGETSKELAQRIGKEPPLVEPELRLLVRIALQEGDLDTAAEALAEAKQRFPQSTLLARRQVDYEKRKGNLDGRVAALQRLVELQPKQKVEWLREITRAFQDAGVWDKALAVVQRVIEEAPASADSHLLAADLNFGAQRFEAGVGKLRDAIKLSDRPNDLRLRLARTFLEAGRVEEAKQTFEAVFDAENDPKARLSLTRQLAEVYLQQGKLDELIGRFRQRQRAEEGGWRYALYLAEIFQQMQDFAGAREELSKALGARSRDGNFLRQLVRLAEAEGNTAESVRYNRLLAEAEPGEEHQVYLADALLDNGDVEEAIKVLRANEQGLLKDPTRWRNVLLKFQTNGAGTELAGFIKAGLATDAGDWRSRLTLAEIELAMGEDAAAESLLWEIFALPPEPAMNASAANSPATGIAAQFGMNPMGWMAQSKYSVRVMRGQQALQNAQQILAAPGSAWGRGRHYGSSAFLSSGMPASPPLKTLEEARDSALMDLAMLAQRQDRAEAFLAELDRKLKAAPRSERIVVYTMLQARDGLFREIAAEGDHPSGDVDLDRFCSQILIGDIQSGFQPGGPEDSRFEQIERFIQREKDPRAVLAQKQSLHEMLARSGRTEEARKLANEILAQADSTDDEMVAMLFGFAVQREALETAEKLWLRLVEASRKPGRAALKQQIHWYSFALADGLLKKEETRQHGVELLADSLKDSYPLRLPASLASFSAYTRRSYRLAWREGQQFPYPNRYINETQIGEWRQAFERLKAADALGKMDAQLNKHIQSLPDDQSVYTQLLRACFRWWGGEQGEAIHEIGQLARELKDDDLRLMVSAMLSEAGEPVEALEVLDQVTASSGDLLIDKLVRMLALARAGKDLERAKEIALRLADLKLDMNDEAQLMNALNQLGMRDKVTELSKRRAGASRASPSRRNQPAEQLQEQVRAKNGKEATALARAILSRDPLATTRQGDEGYLRHQALEALKTFKTLDDYRAELERQLAEAPSSIRTVMLLAEASNLDNHEKALGYYRKLTELKPTDSTFQIRLASLLRESKQPEEALRIWEKLIEKDPGPLLQQSFSFVIESYKEAKQMSRLADALVRMPRPKKSFAANYSGGQMWSEYFNQVAADLQQEGKLPEAIKLWRAALEIAGDNEPWQRPNAFMPLVSALIDTGDKPGAAELIERFFFPSVKPKPLFGFDRQMPHGPWTQIGSHGDGQMNLPALDLLKLARTTGSLEKLREKAVAAASSETDVYASLFVLFIDAQRRDPAVREEFESRLAGIITRSAERSDPMAAQMLFCLAQELQEWPEGRSLALAALRGTQKLVTRSPNAYLDWGIHGRLAEVARELGDDDLARTALRELMAASEKEPALMNQGFRVQQPLRIMEMMADLRMEEEAKVLLKKAKANPQWKQDSTMQRKLADFENRMALLAGKPGQVRIAVWAVAPSAQPTGTTVCWEIGPALKAERGLTASGEEFSIIEGRYSVELFHGASESAMEKIATLPAAKSRGSWTSAAPLAQGFVLAIARDKENVLFSAKTFIPTGPNLIENPLLAETAPLTLSRSGPPSIIRGWPGLSPGLVSYRSDGPQPNARYARLRPPTSAPRESINAQRIKLEPDRKYLLSAWIRASRSDGSARLTGKFFDKDGKEIGTISTNSTVGDGRWVFVPVRLTRGNRAAEGEQGVPAAAVEFEPVIETGMGCDVEDLYFGPVVPEIGEPPVDR